MVSQQNKRKLVYIMAPARSGSTLLTYILASLKGVTTVGELKATAMGDIDNYSCSCGALIKQCGFWGALTKKMNDSGIDFSLDDFGTNFTSKNILCNKILSGTLKNKIIEVIRDLIITAVPVCRHKYKNVLKTNYHIINEICDMNDADVFVDDSKSPLRLKLLCKSGLWDIYIVSLSRDGRGVVTSYMKTTGYTIEKATSEWLHISNEINLAKNILNKENILDVKYEDLCSDTEKTIRNICDFIGIDMNLTNFESLAKENKHILGNYMRLSGSNSIKLDEKWKTGLVGADLKYFTGKAGGVNEKLGYPS